ncbi:MAG TPA: glycosyltransferase, partial [Desulfobacteria bacterium]|nr:glycosyltransferase [Desulfobacteria bacterium]
LFSANEIDRPHEALRNITIYHMDKQYEKQVHESVKIINLFNYDKSSLVYRLAHKLRPQINTKAYWLAKLIKKIKPDIIHSMEMQQNAYLTYEAKKYIRGNFPTWIYSCWGSDIYYFQQFENHRMHITEVLTNCDYLFTDCERDSHLAVKYGFTGEFLGVFPGVGGFKIDEMRSVCQFVKPSERRIITIKGYAGWVYRPETIIKALELCDKELKGFTIVMYLPGEKKFVDTAKEICEKIGVELVIKQYSPHLEMIELFGSARVSLAASISDGTPNSMLEAMVMGSFPIQSDTVSTAEWINDGVNGFLAQPEDYEGYARALKTALIDDNLVDSAANYNLDMLKKKIDYDLVQPKILRAYEHAFEHGKKNP